MIEVKRKNIPCKKNMKKIVARQQAPKVTK